MSGNVGPPKPYRICILTPGHYQQIRELLKRRTHLLAQAMRSTLLRLTMRYGRGIVIVRSWGDLGELFARCRLGRIRLA